MPLQFNSKIEAVRFGDLVAMPRMTTERLMRISKLKFDTEQNLKEGLDIIAECFGENSQAVREYLDKMFLMDIYKLQAYLVGGDETLEAYKSMLQVKANQAKDTNDD